MLTIFVALIIGFIEREFITNVTAAVRRGAKELGGSRGR